jgi:eukaryotic-like serine/threonine-protein kinase
MSSRSARGTGDTLPLAAPGQVLEAGAVIGGRYRLLRWLGSGGMGAVYEVEDSALGAIVALKMTEGASWDASTVAQLKREIMLARRVTHPNVCRVHDFGLHQLPDGRSTPFLTMELLRGETLASLLHREGRLTPDAALGVVRQLAAALDAAHAVGVVHRDFKTGNVMIVGERAVVTDFGLAVDTGDSGAASSGMLVGSPAYMAPEQVRGAARADERADIYAIGAVAFRALSGRLPFEGTTAAVLVSMKLDRAAPSLAEATGEKWPSGIERFLERALERKRERRFGTAAEALTAWRAIQPANITRARRTAQRTRTPTEPPPMPIIEDHPTEVDGPPTVTHHESTWLGGPPGSNRARRKTGRQ